MQIAATLAGLKLALSMIDLTTLEGKDTPEKLYFFAGRRCNRLIQAMKYRKTTLRSGKQGLSPEFALILSGRSREKICQA